MVVNGKWQFMRGGIIAAITLDVVPNRGEVCRVGITVGKSLH